ncbi:hypothetical protein MN608_01261 [Microdochium nivale]|nr:hypothetical protein MN608_01261 [Microdochium nivale]
MDDEQPSQQRSGDDTATTTAHSDGPIEDSHLSQQDEASASSTVRLSIEHDEDDKQDADDLSILSAQTDEEDNEDSFADNSELDHDATHSHISRGSSQRGDGTESGSQHEETDEDIFSDKSPRSSVGSYDAAAEPGKRAAYVDDASTASRSPRVSDISQYEHEDFAPTSRTTPRPRFRTTSDVRTMQMPSPSGSVYGGSPRSPRSPKRSHPTVSRLGTPTQYSPKKGSTPPRFRTIKEAPLVLLHVTLVPLHWAWGDLINTLETSDLSDEMKALRDTWRVLQDRTGDTVVERGVLLGHPQNDYELLEERLLEALELPQRRRARILECGHYLGPSNEMMVTESEESEDETESHQYGTMIKRHWCSTCKNEIRLEELGSSRMFRVKVYASNGLMRAGAWAACWKEMERVDAEIEPIVDASLQDELVRLAALQEERQFSSREEHDIAREVAQRFEAEQAAANGAAFAARAMGYHSTERMLNTPADTPRHDDSQTFIREPPSEDFYPTPNQTQEENTRPRAASHHNDYVPPPSPRSPSEEAQERRDSRKKQFQGASLPQLFTEACKVFLQDRKNLAIIFLSVVALLFALRSAPGTSHAVPAMNGIADDVPQLHVTTAVHTQQVINQAAPMGVAPPVEAVAVDEVSIGEVSVSFQLQQHQQGVREQGVEVIAGAPAAALAKPVMAEHALEAIEIANQDELADKSSRLAVEPERALEIEAPPQKSAVRQETIKVYQTVTETQVKFQTLVETIRIYSTETCQQQLAQPTTPKRLEIGF